MQPSQRVQTIERHSRDSNSGYDNQAAEYGNFYSYGGETRLNFLVKGPDGWGAKTMAFIEGDFRGEQATGGSSSLVLTEQFLFKSLQTVNQLLHPQ